MTTTTTAAATQVYQLFIKATPEQIWDAITKPEFTERYFYGVRIETGPQVRITHAYDGSDDSGEDPIFEWNPPRRLVHGWKSKWNPELSVEEASRVSWELEPQEDGTCLLTVVHDQLEGASKTAASVSGPGWMRVLSGLKTLLETGQELSNTTEETR
jgi:uncharacterized protein YndB with AHSA1/START domain